MKKSFSVHHESEMYAIDIETAPSMGYYYDLWKEGNIVSTVKSWYILSFAVKRVGDKKTYCYALPDFPGYKKNPTDDKLLVAKLWEFLDKADIIVAHNGDRFDIRKINARLIYHGFTPPSPYKTIDTLKVARKYFMFDSNRLNDVGTYLGVGSKLPHMGFKMWADCINKDMKAWAMMKKYNIQDVVLLEQVYFKELAWMTSHPTVSFIDDEKPHCRCCASKDLQKRGFLKSRAGTSVESTVFIAQRYQCKECGAWSSGKRLKLVS